MSKRKAFITIKNHIKSAAKGTRRALKDTFCVRRDERLLAAIILVLLVVLNVMALSILPDTFTDPAKCNYNRFVEDYNVSGFDPITYYTLTYWDVSYNIYRHPFLAFFMYIPYLINQGLIWLTGSNCAIYLASLMQIFCALYGLLFFRRTLKEVVGIDKRSASLITLYLFSFAYMMLSAIVPDHFIFSFMLLMLTLWLSGRWMKGRKPMKIWHTWVLFFLTAGVSLNNGLKTFMTSLFVNRWHFFHPKHFFLAVILPAALIWGSARVSYRHFVWPKEMAKKEALKKKKAEKKRKIKEAKEAERREDSILFATADTFRFAYLDSVSKTKKVKTKKVKKRRLIGRPIAKGEFTNWTDITTSRRKSIIENLFGESLQLHDKYLLEDLLVKRPMFVKYSWTFNAVAEWFIILLFIVGIWCGRHSRFLWMALSWFGLDMLLHVGLGFAINEIYIMTAHWAFVLPLAVAFLFKTLSTWKLRTMQIVLATLTFYLFTYNIWLIGRYFL